MQPLKDYMTQEQKKEKQLKRYIYIYTYIYIRPVEMKKTLVGAGGL